MNFFFQVASHLPSYLIRTPPQMREQPAQGVSRHVGKVARGPLMPALPRHHPIRHAFTPKMTDLYHSPGKSNPEKVRQAAGASFPSPVGEAGKTIWAHQFREPMFLFIFVYRDTYPESYIDGSRRRVHESCVTADWLRTHISSYTSILGDI